MTLWAEFLTNRGRAIHKWTHYFPIYDDHFARYVNRPATILEIGCGLGGSLQLWKRYFGPFAQIIGIDILPACKDFEEEQIEVRIGDQSDTAFLESVIAEFGRPDIILDDGSHMMQHIRGSFAFLYPRMSPTGIYVVEDLHTAYLPKYEGGLRREGSFIELCKDLIDELNATSVGTLAARSKLKSSGPIAPTQTAFTRSTLSMHFYDSVVVFERGPHLEKHQRPLQIPEVHRRFRGLRRLIRNGKKPQYRVRGRRR
jgi:SAM-dependent methyltransferase